MITNKNFQILQESRTIIISEQELQRRRKTVLARDPDTGVETTAEDYLEAVYGDWNWFVFDETDPTPFER